MSAKRKEDRVEFTYELFHQLYVVEDLTCVQIAQRLGYSKSWVGTHLKKYGLKKLHGPEDFPVDVEWLRRRYIDDHRSLQDIATEIGRQAHSVHDRLRAAGVPMRSHGGAVRTVPRDWLVEQYWANNRTLEDLAAELHMGTSAMRRMFNKLNVPRKQLRAAIEVKSIVAPRKPRRNGDFHISTRAKILKRDGNCCRMPGCGSQEKLECHHIIPVRFGGSHTVGNGITVCHKCHWGVLHSSELDWVDRLREYRGGKPPHA